DETIKNQGRFNDQKDTEMLFDVADELRALTEIKSVKPKANKVVIQEPEQGTTTTTLTTTTAAITITAASTRPKAKGLVIHKQEQVPTPIVYSQQPLQVKVQDKGKGKMVEQEPMKKLSKKDQLMLDEELALKLQAKEEEEKRLAREKSQQIKEVNIAWGWKPKSLKNKSFANTQELFNKAMKRVNTFFNYSSELVVESSKEAKAEVTEGCSKRAGEELEQENAKKQKMKDDKEFAELKQCLEIIPGDGDDVTIDATPLSSKSLIIFDYKIHKERKKSYF
nr:hypothetical protein [Tanacetum cinerariifolium]